MNTNIYVFNYLISRCLEEVENGLILSKANQQAGIICSYQYLSLLSGTLITDHWILRCDLIYNIMVPTYNMWFEIAFLVLVLSRSPVITSVDHSDYRQAQATTHEWGHLKAG